MTFSFRQLLFSRLTLWLLIAIGGSYFVYHLQHYVKFGIDLVGGTYITLEVQLEKAQEAELVERMQEIKQVLKKNSLPQPARMTIKGIVAKSDKKEEKETDSKELDVRARPRIVMSFEKQQDAYDVAELLKDRLKETLIDQDGTQVVLALTKQQVADINREAMESNILALNTRVDQFGVGETLVARQGEDRIIVELPNVHNPQEAKTMIGKAALLEIKLVEDSAGSEEELLERYDNDLPEGTMIAPGKPGRRQKFYLVPQYTDITGKQLKTARMGFGGKIGNEPVVEFQFKSAGAERFYELTSANIGRSIAILIDGIVITAPTVQSAISDSGVIIGDFTAEKAQQLALLLRSGAFVAPVTFEEERHIGPSLGAESIKQGLIACLVGLLLLLIFCIFVYKVAGVLAFIVLLYNILFVLLGLWALGATLTLPGIAGVVLTVGMAIDASILIYERIKEELANGETMGKSVQVGFSGAMTVILDANITNFLVALVLYKLGTGPIQGFAVTMIVGIISTLFTGLVMLRSFFSFAIYKLNVNKISI